MSSNKRKTALITGAGQGIGRGIAVRLARDGYNIAIADINLNNLAEAAQEISALGVRVLKIEADVSSAHDVQHMIQATVDEFESLDVLVNNAGIYPFTPFMDITEEQWDKVIAVNLKSVFLCSQAAARIMPDGSRIIMTSSVASMLGFSGLVHYCASKGGINGLVRALALELAPRQITVNAVAPGSIITPGTSNIDEGSQKATMAKIPLGRLGKPQDIAAAVAFLASEGAGYITGQVLVVDGGWTIQS
ncbi:MAG TPA: SDR family NAD(P)-dependent oxidoreductase [bacterium]|jgi:NAD(P)-dependent dehydrogenase (short-subunit alcohol dehydrogenase family)|nr:MAG: 3-oxoacyl-(acyl-carrier-protein) reductase FabG [Parcubacteria group bacterium ADurb.Bin016]HNQ45184.1 SDR family NAD(P)-dependent oxidoreductase [bacterium]HNU90030.1 SDR family NAD(P)-dependent oxidoreductase [bacterium]HOE81143.1 SDR family NAD(P)-dependent oxidoreductase [bacterium]HPU92214.1 SDR family NAD(P)-dependent oxidoreductase [bacterium]